MRRLLFIFNIIFIVCLIFAYISPYVNPSVSLFFSVFGLMYPLIMLVNVAFVLLWLVIKPKYALLSALFVIVGLGPLKRTIGFHTGESNGEGVKVMSYNIGKTRVDFSRKNKSDHIEAFHEFISGTDADIICLQEKTKWHLDIYRDLFRNYELLTNNELGTSICSKFPIVNGGNIPFETVAHNASWADIAIDGDTLRFYSVHLSSNRITKTTAQMLENPDLGNTKVWGDLKFIFDRYNKHAQLRSLQVDQIIDHARQSEYPVVIAGDFNDVTQSYIYRKMCKHFKDAFSEAGSGMPKTFISVIPALRIDYTFVSDEIKVVDHFTIKTGLSDHYPVVTIIDAPN